MRNANADEEARDPSMATTGMEWNENGQAGAAQ